MDTSRIRITHQKDEVAPNVFSDFEWIRAHRKELLDQYGECVLLVYEQHVIGHGTTLQEAIEDAERQLPANIEQITPVLQYLAPLSRLYRVQASDKKA